MNVQVLQPSDALCPSALANQNKPPVIQTLGNQQLLAASKTAILCSRSCPGEVILRIYDLARRLRDSELTFIGGFHTPVERDFLHHLLAGSCKLIICPARTLENMRLPGDWRKAVEAGRMMLLSHFTGEAQRRQSARLAERRNELVMSLANQILLLHAARGSQTENLAEKATTIGIPVVKLGVDDEVIRQRLL